MGRCELDRILAFGLVLLSCAVWFHADMLDLRGLLFLVLMTLVVAQDAPWFLRLVILLAVGHLATSIWGITVWNPEDKVWVVRYTLAISQGVYMTAGVLLVIFSRKARE